MQNELVLGLVKLTVDGVSIVVSGLVLFYIKRYIARRSDAEKEHTATHERIETNFTRIDDHHPEWRLETKKQGNS